ncbi:peritrophin-48 [Drosophila guanche]|uniref:Blast:Peritrophin-44 n=2 Tax=Drosophila guanche TaxID=7266 RepID=A0A3B0KG07_DROGU|nr:peritrophin-48 [Drosophila guanche]SPP84676.1 blast:Peritrophin-44 [Drosophila guanche]
MRGSTSYMLYALLLALVLQLSHQSQLLNSGDDVCRLFADGTKLRKPGGCNEWIVCQNQVSTTGGTCSGTTPYFSLSKGTCHKTLDTTYCASPCTSTTNGYVGSTLNCANWYYCEKKTLKGSGSCTGQFFDQKLQQCVYAENTSCAAKFEWCDIVPINVPFRDEGYCNKYYICDKSYKLIENTCELGKYYDVQSKVCVAKKNVDCGEHPLPVNVCGTKKLAVRNKFVSDGATCRGYFYCRDLGSGVPDPNPERLQCGVDYFFNVERQACMPRETQKCDEDRCDGRDSGFELASVKGCHNYLTCADGKEVNVLTCGDEYFDVEAQKCTPTIKTYGACTA